MYRVWLSTIVQRIMLPNSVFPILFAYWIEKGSLILDVRVGDGVISE
jgi:hypothetical protein